MFSDFLKAHEQNTRAPATSRHVSGITRGGLLICAEVMETYQENERQKNQEERKKAERVPTQVARQAAKEASATATTARGRGRGDSTGNGRSGVSCGYQRTWAWSGWLSTWQRMVVHWVRRRLRRSHVGRHFYSM